MKYALHSLVLHYLNVLFTQIRCSDMKLSGLAKTETYIHKNSKFSRLFASINVFFFTKLVGNA